MNTLTHRPIRFKALPEHSDEDVGVATLSDIEREERQSHKLGMIEDREEEEKERQRKEEKKRRKAMLQKQLAKGK